MCILLTWVIYTLIFLPTHFWPTDVIYRLYPLDYYCGIPYDKTGGLAYMAVAIYMLPVILISIIYARLIFFIRHQTSHTVQLGPRNRTQRDFLVTRRILFIVNALTVTGFFNVLFFIVTSIKPSFSGSFYMYRIQWMIPAVVVCGLSIALLITTPQLKALTVNRIMKPDNRVVSMSQRPHERTMHVLGLTIIQS
jgi:hypothetical protein